MLLSCDSSWRVWEFVSDPSSLLMDGYHTLVLCSSLYYILDTVLLLHARYSLVERMGFLLHHCFCLYGLLSPVLAWHRNEPGATDIAMVTLGFIIAEVQNPLRIIGSHLRGRTRDQVLLTHFIAFVLTRLLCAKFTLHIVLPHARLLSTKISACMLLLFSAVSTVLLSGQDFTSSLFLPTKSQS